MENVYLEIIKLLSEGSIFRILLILFSFFSFLLFVGVGFLWFKSPELFKEILRAHSQTPETIEAESKITNLQPVSSLNLIRGLFLFLSIFISPKRVQFCFSLLICELD